MGRRRPFGTRRPADPADPGPADPGPADPADREPAAVWRSRLSGRVVVGGSLVIAGAILAGVSALGGGQQPRALPAVNISSRAPAAVAGSPKARAPEPRPSATGQDTERDKGPAPMLPPYGQALAASDPVRLTIPAIGVSSSVIPLGANPDGSVAVPPLSEPRLASWFDEGPAPGQDGPAAVYGHVDTAAAGPGVFYRLGDLTAGDMVDVALADQRVADFQVYRVAQYPKDAFPTMTVYGNTPVPELRLITCGGRFDAAAGSYDDNIVAYARLTGVSGR
ncbi:MAG TPA: class F sortase [Trebonia sp.]